MKDIQFVSADKVKTLEHYASALVSSMVTLRTLESFHIAAFNQGLLEDDEAETGKTICWEIRRLMSLYKTQMENVLDRTELDEQAIIDSLKALMPDVKKSRKKKVEEWI